MPDVIAQNRYRRSSGSFTAVRKRTIDNAPTIPSEITTFVLIARGKPSAGVTLEQAEAAVREELELLQQELVDEQELEKVKNKFESTQIFGNINYLNVATNLAWYELLGRAEDMEKEVDRYRSVTAEQLRAVAQSAFRKENGVILYYKKQQN